MPRCTSARRAWSRSWSERRSRSRSWAARGCTPPRVGWPIRELVPEEPNRGYDMRKVIDAIVDEGSWLEIKKLFAKELLIGFARLDGHAVGIVANQPMQKGGVLFND